MASRKNLCLSLPDRGLAVELPLGTTGQASWEANAAGRQGDARYRLEGRADGTAGGSTSA